MGAGGVIVPPRTYFQKIMLVCAKHDLFVISDEVICGFGRLGTMFGCQQLGFKPQSISVAKALSSAYLPIAAVMIPELMYEALLAESKKIGTFGHGFTYGGHPVSAAVALKAIEIYGRERIIEKAAKRAPLFQARLKLLGQHPLVGEARGLGLIGGVELVADKASKRSFEPQHDIGARAVRFAEEEGLIVRSVAGDVLTLSPPLVINAVQIEELFNRLTRALDKTLDWVTRGRLTQA
jgi:4-aminobutyrate--pyruvate transaminase